MTAPHLPEVPLGPQRSDGPALPLASEGVQRYVWQSAFGPMLIEVRDGAVFVNGERVTSMDELRADSANVPLGRSLPIAETFLEISARNSAGRTGASDPRKPC
jgi:hypothetical protein